MDLLVISALILAAIGVIAWILRQANPPRPPAGPRRGGGSAPRDSGDTRI